MKIVYITPLWSGLRPFFVDGSEMTSGMPAFYEVFTRLLNRSDVENIYVIAVFVKFDQVSVLPRKIPE